MKMIMIAIAMVALGVGQITTAQQNPEGVSIGVNLPDQATLQRDLQFFQQGSKQKMATWIMMATANVIQSDTVWGCKDTEQPPNCAVVGTRPPNVQGCDPWRFTFSWAQTVVCPPTQTHNFTFWTPNGPLGGFQQVGYWTPGLPPSGKCNNPGYLSTIDMPPMVDSACMPTPTPSPTPSCCGQAFPAFDGSGRRFLTKTTTSNGTWSDHNLPYYDINASFSSTKTESACGSICTFSGNGNTTCVGPSCGGPGCNSVPAGCGSDDGFVSIVSGLLWSSPQSCGPPVNQHFPTTCPQPQITVNGATSRTLTWHCALQVHPIWDGVAIEALSDECPQ